MKSLVCTGEAGLFHLVLQYCSSKELQEEGMVEKFKSILSFIDVKKMNKMDVQYGADSCEQHFLDMVIYILLYSSCNLLARRDA